MMNTRVSLFVAPLLLASQIAHALPDPKRGDDLARLGLTAANTGGATLLLDHAENTLYVGPAANKTMEGVFSFVDGVVSCETLGNIRETTYRDKMGLSCNITQRPVGATPEESRRMNEALEQALYGDMFAMFVMQYGKEYKLEKNPMPPASGELHPLATAGNGVMSLCGGVNVYCAVAGLVLKTVDEMVGARHTGRTSSAVDVGGKISRNFSKDSYLVAEGTTSVLMTVKASN
jgi:hypothetical protein